MSTIKFVETSNVKRAKQAISSALKKNGFTAIIADVGSGKTTLTNHLTQFWESKAEAVIVQKIKMMNNDNKVSRIPNIMRMIIQKIDPETYIPQDSESRYEILERVLRNADAQKKKVILIIDEAQDANNKTMRDLKKIHEIAGNGKEHLMAILLFAKPRYNMRYGLDSKELGFRIHQVMYDNLTDDDKVLLAEERFDLRFSSPKTKERFCRVLNYCVPLDIELFSKVITKMPSFNATISDAVLHEYTAMGLKYRMMNVGLTVTDAAEELRRIRPDIKNPRAVINDIRNGHMDPEQKLAKDVSRIVDGLIAEKAQEKLG